MPARPLSGRTTVDAFLAWWLGIQRASEKSPNTIDKYEWAIRGWISPALGRLELRKVRAEHVEDLLLDMQRQGLAKNSMVRVRSTFSMALDQAVRRGLVERNVATLAIVPRGPKREGRSLTYEQVLRLFAASKGDRLETLVIMGVLLGLRPGELAGLRWDSVDLRRRVLTVHEARLEEPGGMRLGGTKTRRSRRSLDMPALLVASLTEHRRRQAREKKAAGRRWKEHGLVFSSTVGTPIDRWRLRRRVAELTEAAGLGLWTPRELRHTCVSLLSDAGVPIETIADVMGHANARVTGEIYRHPVHPTVDAARVTMDRVFGNTRRRGPTA
ncbi:MAG: tyrosine-type recombinase/integrase [Acidimicrobiales bacterium]